MGINFYLRLQKLKTGPLSITPKNYQNWLFLRLSARYNLKINMPILEKVVFLSKN